MWIFEPILKSTIWGGDRIASFKKIKTDMTDVGESWEVSGVEGSESVVAAGPDKGLSLSSLIDKYGSDLVGERNFIKYGDLFPMLVKFIDASRDLSIQVHPDDDIARKHGKRNGKTEMWYVLNAEKGARLALGFKEKINPDEYEKLVESGKIEEVLNFIPIKKGDVFYIPGGRVHAIGAGAFVVEIQQTSDDTYRIYDYHRKDKDGNERQLHTELAKECIRFDDTNVKPVEYTPHRDIPVNLVSSQYFYTNLLQIDEVVLRDYSEWDTFVIIIATHGKASLTCGEETIDIHEGMSVLIPASARMLTIKPKGNFTALETYIK